MVMSPEVSWRFFKAVRAGLAVKRPYLSHTGRASNAEKQPTGLGPEGCDENRPTAALLVRSLPAPFLCRREKTISERKMVRDAPLTPVRLGPPCRRPILIATIHLLFLGQDASLFGGPLCRKRSRLCRQRSIRSGISDYW